MRNFLIFLLITVVGASGWLLGNQAARKSAAVKNDEDIATPVIVRRPTVIRAIGKLEPQNGIAKVFAPQGERIDSLYNLNVGDRVTAGQPVVKLASLEIRQLELRVAQAKQYDAMRQMKFEESKGKQKQAGAALAVADATAINDQIAVKGEALALLHRQRAAAQDQLVRLESLKSNELTANMIGQTDLEKQRLLIAQVQSKIEAAKTEIKLATEKADRARQAAQLELDAAAMAVRDGSNAMFPHATLDSAIDAARKAVELSEIKAPVSGEILDIIVRPGDTAVNQPVLLIGDTEKMVCVAEVNDVNLRYIKTGNNAIVTSVALGKPILGKVISNGMMIGPPSMKDPNPFASVDRKTGRVTILLDDSAEIRNFVNLQVDVEIDLGVENE